jgi:hypothetical protein
MQKKFQLHCYSATNNRPPFSFYILCKGLNSGKPLQEPCPNCLVLTAANQTDCEFYYWLCWGLWQARKFHFYIRGSVIPFVRICDVKECIEKHEQILSDKPGDLQKCIAVFKNLIEYETLLEQKRKTIKQLKQAYFHSMLR